MPRNLQPSMKPTPGSWADLFSMPEYPITITLLANAGLLVEYRGARILIDGLFARQGHPFSTLPPAVYDELMRGEGPFANVDHLIFSHAHPDHYDPVAVAQYLKSNRVRTIYLPAGACRNELIKEIAKAQGVHVWESTLTLGQAYLCPLQSGIRLLLMALPHMDMGALGEYAKVDCNCIVLELGGRRLLFSGDCDALPPTRFEPFAQAEIEAAFINPYFFHMARGKAALNDYIRPKRIFICHLPFEGEEDALKLHALVRYDLRHAEGIIPVPLHRPFQQVVLT